MTTSLKGRAKDRFDELPDWLTPREARVLLRVSRTSLYSMIRDGSLPHRRFGRLIRLPKEALRPSVAER